MEKLKWVCEYSCDGTNLSFEKDRAYGFSWPQRNYRCSFCKKEFKSAQALGGHMNVHRRDRARLRLSPNSNPNPSFPPSLAKLFPYNAACHSPFTPVISSPSLQQDTVPGVDLGKKKKNEIEFGKRKDARVWKANELIRLDLNLGLLQDAKEDLDLELRLGYS